MYYIQYSLLVFIHVWAGMNHCYMNENEVLNQFVVCSVNSVLIRKQAPKYKTRIPTSEWYLQDS